MKATGRRARICSLKNTLLANGHQPGVDNHVMYLDGKLHLSFGEGSLGIYCPSCSGKWASTYPEGYFYLCEKSWELIIASKYYEPLLCKGCVKLWKKYQDTGELSPRNQMKILKRVTT